MKRKLKNQNAVAIKKDPKRKCLAFLFNLDRFLYLHSTNLCQMCYV